MGVGWGWGVVVGVHYLSAIFCIPNVGGAKFFSEIVYPLVLVEIRVLSASLGYSYQVEIV